MFGVGFISRRPPRVLGVPSAKETRPGRLDPGRVSGAYRGPRLLRGRLRYRRGGRRAVRLRRRDPRTATRVRGLDIAARGRVFDLRLRDRDLPPEEDRGRGREGFPPYARVAARP
jgi:hypothetical protein